MKEEQRETENTEEMKRQERAKGKPVVAAGLLLILMEIWKQLTLWLIVGKGQYNVWYFPFQLCSLPMYISLLYAVLQTRRGPRIERWKRTCMTFLQDYGFLGGLMALLFHAGLMHPGHPFLTAHGFLWHGLMLLLALYIHTTGLSDSSTQGFRSTLPIFAVSALLAECINVALHRYGDCDMFYISPYHLSSQLVFCSIDAIIGRPAGIALYLACVVLGASLIHLAFQKLPKYAGHASRKI